MGRTDGRKLRLALRKECMLLDKSEDSSKLMSNAADQLYLFITNNIMPNFSLKSILVFVGPGNNGGDALYMAKKLLDSGFSKVTVCVFEAGNPHLDSLDLDVIEYDGSEKQKNKFNKYSLVVDGIFGVGLNKDIEGVYSDAISCINQTLLPVLSVDVPSGLNCDTGKILNVAIEATWTLTFGVSKPGFYICDGPRLVGQLRCVDIGYSKLSKYANSIFLLDRIAARSLFPKRSDMINKSSNGKTCIIAGRDGMWGAGILASRGAFRVGSGYVMFYSFDDPKSVLEETPEVILGSFEKLSDIYEDGMSFAVGPGLGIDERAYRLICDLKEKDCKVILDADALSVLAKYDIKDIPSHWLLTPHSGEMARLLGCSSFDVESDRILALKDCALKYGCNVLLKGYRTLVGNSSRVDIINSGNSSLATAGTGDVLSGMIAGFVSQGLNVLDAAGLASFLHGHTADVWIKSGKSKNSMMASDVVDMLPGVLKYVE